MLKIMDEHVPATGRFEQVVSKIAADADTVNQLLTLVARCTQQTCGTILALHQPLLDEMDEEGLGDDRSD